MVEMPTESKMILKEKSVEPKRSNSQERAEKKGKLLDDD